MGTKVIKLGYSGHPLEVANGLIDNGLDDEYHVMFNLYGNNDDIEAQDKTKLLKLVKWFKKNGFRRSAYHIERVMKWRQ